MSKKGKRETKKTDLPTARIGKTPDVDVEFRVGRKEERFLETEEKQRRSARRLDLFSFLRRLELTLKGKNNGNQLSISGLTRCIRSGWIESPTSP